MKIRIILIAALAALLLSACRTKPESKSPFVTDNNFPIIADGDPLFFVDGIKWQKEYIRKPYTMHVMIGGAMGTSYELTYDGRELKYYKAGDFFSLQYVKPELIEVTREDWQAFSQEFEKLNNKNWQKHYEDKNIHDGTYWRAVVYYDSEQDIMASGSNAYPDDFPQLINALKKLIGQREFK